MASPGAPRSGAFPGAVASQRDRIAFIRLVPPEAQHLRGQAAPEPHPDLALEAHAHETTARVGQVLPRSFEAPEGSPQRPWVRGHIQREAYGTMSQSLCNPRWRSGDQLTAASAPAGSVGVTIVRAARWAAASRDQGRGFSATQADTVASPKRFEPPRLIQSVAFPCFRHSRRRDSLGHAAVVSSSPVRAIALDEIRASRLTIGSRSLPSAIAEARTSSSVTTAGRPKESRATPLAA
jgi:hypothetical protein